MTTDSWPQLLQLLDTVDLWEVSRKVMFAQLMLIIYLHQISYVMMRVCVK
jgi:hypothetical protein